jgi:hypothetical protein
MISLPEQPSSTLTQLLERRSGGDSSALNEITPIVYREFRLLADGYLQRESRVGAWVV